MDRFKTLPSVLLNNDRAPLKRAEEIAVVIGLAAARLRQRLDRQEEALFMQLRRVGIGIAALVLVLAVLGSAWLLNNGRGSSVPALIVGAVIMLALIGLGLALAPYSKRFRVSSERAAITRVARLYWPVGILPLGSDRVLLWDGLTEPGGAIDVIDLPPAAGIDQERAAAGARKVDSALTALIRYEAELEKIGPERSGWPVTPPDTSLQQLGAEVGDVWKRMAVPMEDESAAVLGSSAEAGANTWRAVADEGERVYTFHREIESLRLLTERYRQRAQQMVERARELAVEHGFGLMQTVEEARAAQFDVPEGKDPAVAPGAVTHLSIATSADQVRENLETLRAALTPLDEQIESDINHLARAEEADIRAVESGHITEHEELQQLERAIVQSDSDILKLAQSLDTYRQRMEESRAKILAGYDALGEVPVETLHANVRELEKSVISATESLNGAAPRLDLPSLERTVSDLTKALAKAHQAWNRLSTDLPERGKDVQNRLEAIQESLKGISEGHLALSPDDVTELLNSVKNVERVTRNTLSWTTSQQDPLSPIEDHDQELKRQLAALNELRRGLERANTTFAHVTAAEGEGARLPLLLQETERAVREVERLSIETSSAAAALNNSAETIQKQALRIEQLMQERDRLRTLYDERSAALLATIEREREAVRNRYAGQRESIAALRGQLDEVPNAVTARLKRVLAEPHVPRGGVTEDPDMTPWSEIIVNQIALAIEEWGARVAGIDGRGSEPPLIQQLHDELEARHQVILQHAVPAQLAPDANPLSPHICFVPFWFVESETHPDSEATNRRMVHLFPPLHMSRPSNSEMPAIEGLRYRELTRRMLTWLRRDYLNGGDPLESLAFDPEVLTERAQQIPREVGAPLWQELATALAQHWVFFRSDDPLLNRIILNSRDTLLPASQFTQGELADSNQPALTDEV